MSLSDLPDRTELEACIGRNATILKTFLDNHQTYQEQFNGFYTVAKNGLESNDAINGTILLMCYYVNGKSEFGAYLGNLTTRPADSDKDLTHNLAYLMWKVTPGQEV